MLRALKPVQRLLGSTLRDLAPLFLVIGFFQAVVLQQPFPNLLDVGIGLIFVVIGLTLFVGGLKIGLFPLGEAMAESFARKGSLSALLAFAFLLGFTTTIAEPALIAVVDQAGAAAAAANVVADQPDAIARYALWLRITVALSVGIALVIGVIRIVRGWPIQILIIAGYTGIAAMTAIAPPEIVGIAYDSGGVTTSTVTVPLVAALGVGLASVIRGRNPVVDGFGLIAFASLTPMMFVLAFGTIWKQL
ncbi:conserved membrane hypothetical protein [Candidatus Defluviicoccus seviourii]|uniref:DUF1538 domain-containing protein n=2 Tax=root TaxID=1 RepID=A0A564WEF3_9PROT|nr:conserved membrane hypothetical protein [uncultured Defluviicoccus sp.]VUX46852.1 conserved membrane hypothetical protein [Candidatus Defluviicoccus seviourii]HRW60520.1 DUF1538 domain-containing protein [Defluviicoccus sp.]